MRRVGPSALTFGETALRPVSEARPVQLTANNHPQVHHATVWTVGAEFLHHHSVFRCPAQPQHIPTNNASKFRDLRVTDPDSKPCANEATCQFTQTHIVCTEYSEAQFGKGVLSNFRIGMLQEVRGGIADEPSHLCQAGGIPLIYRNPASLILIASGSVSQWISRNKSPLLPPVMPGSSIVSPTCDSIWDVSNTSKTAVVSDSPVLCFSLTQVASRPFMFEIQLSITTRTAMS